MELFYIQFLIFKEKLVIYNLNTIDCPICKFNCTKSIHVQIVDHYPYIYHLCKICGFVFQQRRYEREHYEKLPCSFPKDYDAHSWRRASYILDFCKNSFDAPVFCSPSLTPKILDIGCGPGGVMKYIKRMIPDSEVSGYTLDMGEEKQTDLQILYRNIEDFYKLDFMATEKHDFIILSHVTEHFYDLRTAMNNIYKHLAVNGILYIEVPSFHWCEVRTPSKWTPEHLSYFTKRSLTNLLNNHGFKILRIKDSRYWGNIKVVATTQNEWDVEMKPESGWWTMIKHYLAKASYPYYRTKKWHINPGANA